MGGLFRLGASRWSSKNKKKNIWWIRKWKNHRFFFFGLLCRFALRTLRQRWMGDFLFVFANEIFWQKKNSANYKLNFESFRWNTSLQKTGAKLHGNFSYCWTNYFCFTFFRIRNTGNLGSVEFLVSQNRVGILIFFDSITLCWQNSSIFSKNRFSKVFFTLLSQDFSKNRV